MSDWPGLTHEQVRQLARALAMEIIKAREANMPPGLPGFAWLNVRLTELGCPEDELEMWRERIESTPLADIADQTARRQ